MEKSSQTSQTATPANVALIERLYAAYRSGDYEAFAELCTPDIEWIQNEGFPYGGHHRGSAAIIEGVFETLPRHWEGFGFDVEEMRDTGNGVLVIGVYRGIHRESRKPFRAATVHVFDIEGGHVRRFRQYTDTALVQEATRG